MTTSLIETEKKFLAKDIPGLIECAISSWFSLSFSGKEELDTYFTDKEERFIKDRTCLRVRKQGNVCEITYKWPSSDWFALYSKVEHNLSLSHTMYEQALWLLELLWFLRYTEVKKERTLYKKSVWPFIYHIAIDYIVDIWYFVEFEILSPRHIQKATLWFLLENFVKPFLPFLEKEENLPYRDLVMEHTKERIAA